MAAGMPTEQLGMLAPPPMQAPQMGIPGGPPMPLGAMQDGMPMLPPPPQKMYDVKIKRCITSGQLKVKNIPPEDFLLDPNAVKVDEHVGRFYADVVRMTRSDAKLKWPDKKAVIDELPAYVTSANEYGREKQARENRFWSFREVQTDPATEEIEVYECYVNVDFDNDGVAEWRQICMGGMGGDRAILSNEEFGGPLPYVSVTPNPMPHRYRGRSLYDDVGDIQRVKTVLTRQLNDNLYWVNNAMQVANSSAIENKDMLLSPEVGGVVWANGDPNGAVVPLPVPFIGDKVLNVLEYYDMVMEKRTGVSRSTMALDTDTLQYQTATAVNETRSSAFSKIETLARNIAECGGFKELFSKLLQLFVENQKSVKYIRVSGDLVPMDPRGWNADMHVCINIGLGAGSRDKDMASLGGIAAKQELAIQGLQGPFNPLLNVGHLFTTYRRMVETAGLKNPEQYFPEVSQQQVAQIAQQSAQNQKPPPEVMKAQAQIQIEQMKLQGDQQRDQNRAQIDMMQANHKAQIEQIQAQSDIATQNKKAESEAALEQQRFQLEQQRMLMQHSLDVAKAKADVLSKSHGGKDAMGNPIGPDPAAQQAALAQFDNIQVPIPPPVQSHSPIMADALHRLATALAAPTEVVRDHTGKVVGSRKRL